MTFAATGTGQETGVWIGTGAAQPSRGIYYCTLNTKDGKLSQSRLVAEVVGPGFLALHPQARVLYAVGTLENKPAVIAYSISKADGQSQLTLMNWQEIGDGGAAHVSVHPSGKLLLTAQYGGGSVAVFPLNADGSLQPRSQLVDHTGGSQVVAGRQEASHAHWTGFSPDAKFAFVPDLGLDKVMIYKVDVGRAQIESHGFGELPPGAGPRHMKFHTNGKWIYVLNELDVSVSVFDYDAAAGTMTRQQTIAAVPKEELAKEQTSSASEIRVHPTGRFVYSANRGHDTITVFKVDQSTGKLSVVEREPVRGATPRNFNLDSAGQWLLAAGQDSHTLASFAVNAENGELTYNRSIIQTPAPICVLFDQQ